MTKPMHGNAVTNSASIQNQKETWFLFFPLAIQRWAIRVVERSAHPHLPEDDVGGESDDRTFDDLDNLEDGRLLGAASGSAPLLI
jgi:hypothetical protein